MAVPPETTTTNTQPAPSSSNAGNGSNNKQPTSSHRLPTVSASEAFRDLSSSSNNNGNDGEKDKSKNHPPSNAYTGIAELDDALGGGFECGKVTELWGPPGAGKTAVALSAAASVLQKGSSVVWIDTTHPLSPQHLTSLISPTHLPSFHQTHLPTLSHLLTLLLYPPPTFPSPTTALLILTNLHALLEISNPRNPAPSKISTAPGSISAPSAEARKYALSRRQALLSTLSSLLNQLAARHGIAVLVTTGCATRMNHNQTSFNSGSAGRLSLVPGVGGREWESGIWARACVGRDFGGRWVGVSKVRGSSVGDDQGGLGRVVWFETGEGGRAVALPAVGGEGFADARVAEGKGFTGGTPMRGRKRAVEEIADSDEEDEANEFGGWEGLELEEAGEDGVDGGGGLAAVDGGGVGEKQEGPEQGAEEGAEEGAEKAGR